MKKFATVLKIVAAIAAIGAAIYVGIAYGDKIVAWVRSLFERVKKAPCCEEVPAEDICCEEAAPEEAVQAEEDDFAN